MAALQLADTGTDDEANEAPQSGSSIPGWYVVFLNKFDHPAASSASLGQLSGGGRVISARVEEHVMFSEASEFRDGRLVWSVTHDAQKGIFDLSATGNLPESFVEMRDRLQAQQQAEGGEAAEVDYIFDIPIVTAASVCGYQHDKWKFDWGEPKFTELKDPKISQSFLARLLRPSR